MNYLKGISLKGIAIGFVGGYCVPYGLLKSIVYILAALGVNRLYGVIPLVMVALIIIIAPLVSGYLGAKYSSSFPFFNGVLATVFGVVAFATVGQMDGLAIYFIVITLALLFGYAGARRYVVYG